LGQSEGRAQGLTCIYLVAYIKRYGEGMGEDNEHGYSSGQSFISFSAGGEQLLASTSELSTPPDPYPYRNGKLTARILRTLAGAINPGKIKWQHYSDEASACRVPPVSSHPPQPLHVGQHSACIVGGICRIDAETDRRAYEETALTSIVGETAPTSIVGDRSAGSVSYSTIPYPEMCVCSPP
jgi:hypothetical protein